MPATLRERLRSPARPRLEYLLAGFFLAALLRPAGPRARLSVAGREIPELCLIHNLTGHRCPGCGMTRGLVYLFRGEPVNAVRANPMAPFVFSVLLQAGSRPRRLLRPVGSAPLESSEERVHG